MKATDEKEREKERKREREREREREVCLPLSEGKKREHREADNQGVTLVTASLRQAALRLTHAECSSG